MKHRVPGELYSVHKDMPLPDHVVEAAMTLHVFPDNGNNYSYNN